MAGAALALLVGACGGSSDANCPNDLPAACPSTPPSFATDVQPILGNNCRTCHSPGGQESSIPLLTYDQVFQRRSSVLNQVHACRMPPDGSPAPSATERVLLQAWLVCGAPNN